RRIDESRRRNTVETFTERIRHEVHLPWLRGTHIDGANGCSLCRSRINETTTARRGLAREGDRLRKAKPMPRCGKRMNALWARSCGINRCHDPRQIDRNRRGVRHDRGYGRRRELFLRIGAQASVLISKGDDVVRLFGQVLEREYTALIRLGPILGSLRQRRRWSASFEGVGKHVNPGCRLAGMG